MSAPSTSKRLAVGIGMTVTFAGVLVAIFLPLFSGRNALNYLDNLYNSISKGSAYYIPELRERSHKHDGQQVKLTLALKDNSGAEQAAKVLSSSGAKAVAAGSTVEVEGDLGAMLSACLEDADRMFHNDGQALLKRHGMDERLALYTWWNVLAAMVKDLNHQEKFAEAETVSVVGTKAVECAYNFYRIEPQKISDRWGIVLISLIFYVIYTVWYGFGILYLFEGAGFKLEHH